MAENAHYILYMKCQSLVLDYFLKYDEAINTPRSLRNVKIFLFSYKIPV